MKFLHIADLHIGKRVNGYDMLEDQSYILDQILNAVQSERPDGVLIAGDVYDKPIPSAEAVRLFDDFLCRLSALKTETFIISGNHDSPERLAFGARLMRQSGVHIVSKYEKDPLPYTLKDAYGEVDVWLLPYLKPSVVRHAFDEEEKVDSYNEAMRLAVSNLHFTPGRRNIAVVHQFLTGAHVCDSEEVSVGGLDRMDYTLFDAFDYTALGHLHGPQKVGREAVRYCGSPLKYSFSECSQKKSITIAELGEPGDLSIRLLPLKPLRDMIRLKGSFYELTHRNLSDEDRYAYYELTLTDEQEIPDAGLRLRSYYPNWMNLLYDNKRTRSYTAVESLGEQPITDPMSLFAGFYFTQNNQELSDLQREILSNLIAEIWEEKS